MSTTLRSITVHVAGWTLAQHREWLVSSIASAETFERLSRGNSASRAATGARIDAMLADIAAIDAGTVAPALGARA
jgi:hypothetical protein